MPGRLSPPSQTPLLSLPAVALDLETTGLDVRTDRVIQIGLVALNGAEILDQPRIDQLVDPEMSVPADAARITGIADETVAGSPRLAEVIETLRDAISGNVVIGQHIAFDLAILRHEAVRLEIDWVEPVALDIGHLLGGMEPSMLDFGLETIAERFDVEITGRHTALGDSLAVAEIFVKLLGRLRENVVRTLAEALALAARRQDLFRREEEAGWRVTSAGETALHTSSPLRIDSYVFSSAIRDVMSTPPIFVTPSTELLAAAEVMTARKIGALLVGHSERAPEGIVTERDILRAFVETGAVADRRTVADIMSAPVETISADELLYRGLARMDHLEIRHLCVASENGAAIGMLSQRDLLKHRARSEAVVNEMVASATDSAALALAFSRVGAVAEGLANEGMDGRGTARVISRELRSVTARAADIALARLKDDGRGGPPAAWCLLVLGSGGRGESLLSADQDNALIHAGTSADDAWFSEFGQHIADTLNDAGVPYCDGGVMASNAKWRGSRSEWRERVEHWLERAQPDDLLSVDIFFDMRPVAGDSVIASSLIEDAVAGAAKSRPFLSLLAQSVEQHTPSFGLFGRPKLEGDRQDLKRDGLLPLVSFARAVGLRSGSTARSTPDRIADAGRAGKIGESDAAVLDQTLILQQQLSDIRAGIRVSSRVDVSNLSRVERKALRTDLGRMSDIVAGVRSLMA
ncbi:MAG: DNA polymerase III subunit epsilon [Rhodospirillaceae bacterium]|nr:DNA polymerase III subunit epsilon [Rhodospirillaceae bacterium]